MRLHLFNVWSSTVFDGWVYATTQNISYEGSNRGIGTLTSRCLMRKCTHASLHTHNCPLLIQMHHLQWNHNNSPVLIHGLGKSSIGFFFVVSILNIISRIGCGVSPSFSRHKSSFALRISGQLLTRSCCVDWHVVSFIHTNRKSAGPSWYFPFLACYYFLSQQMSKTSRNWLVNNLPHELHADFAEKH